MKHSKIIKYNLMFLGLLITSIIGFNLLGVIISSMFLLIAGGSLITDEIKKHDTFKEFINHKLKGRKYTRKRLKSSKIISKTNNDSILTEEYISCSTFIEKEIGYENNNLIESIKSLEEKITFTSDKNKLDELKKELILKQFEMQDKYTEINSRLKNKISYLDASIWFTNKCILSKQEEPIFHEKQDGDYLTVCQKYEEEKQKKKNDLMNEANEYLEECKKYMK